MQLSLNKEFRTLAASKLLQLARSPFFRMSVPCTIATHAAPPAPPQHSIRGSHSALPPVPSLCPLHVFGSYPIARR
jgi:hypothetical protein